jgi:hypothetical protein
LTTNRPTWTRNDFSYLLLTLALTIFAVAPLAYPGYLQVHSGFVPIYNLAQMASEPVSTGWSPEVVTSFDPLRGDGPLSYYLALLIVQMGGTPLSGVKIVFALSFLLGAAGVYLWLRRALGPAGAALAALVYTYLPYRIAAVYVRGAWGEALFLGLLPWALATATFARFRHAPISSLILTALVWALVGLSQAGLAFWAFLLLAAWLLLVDRAACTRKQILANGLAALLGLLVALVPVPLLAGFSLPRSPVDFFEHFLYPAQLFSAYWGFGASRPGWDDGLALGFGFAAVALGILTLGLAFNRRRTNTAEPDPAERLVTSPNPLTLSILALALTLLLLSPLAFLWRLTGLYHTLTYPWQLLALVGLLLSTMAGAAVKLDKRLANPPVYAALVTLTLLASYRYLEPRFTQHPAGSEPVATWDAHHLMLLDYELSVAIPPAAAGLSESTPGQLPLDDYGRLRPGDTLIMAFTWQATRPFYKDLKLFVHLLDTSGQVIAQVDPLAGAGAGPDDTDYFISRWDPGELILDEVTLALPANAPPGSYRLALGLYDGETLERLPVEGRQDRQIEIEITSNDSEPLSLSLSPLHSDLESH